MALRILSTFIAFFLLIEFQGQTKPLSGSATVQSVTVNRHDTCLNKKFSVVVYIIQDSMYQMQTPAGLSTYTLAGMFDSLNRAFAPICVSFEHCKTVFIPNHTYNTWKPTHNGAAALNEWYTDNTISVFLPKEILMNFAPDNPEPGYAFSADTVNRLRNSIVIEKDKQITSTLLHVFGHFFGLPHTCAEINPTLATNPPTPAGVISREFVDGSNCAIHGDGFCDTEADPWPAASNLPYANQTSCAPMARLDGKGQFYVPPSANYMSMYQGCRGMYSPEQYYAMVKYILRKRLYLH